MARRLQSVMGAALLVVFAWPAAAQQPQSSAANDCPELGPIPCAGQADCADQAFATACFDGQPATCRVSCAAVDAQGQATAQADPTRCSSGETCVQGWLRGPGNPSFFCRPSRFEMDLNLLDQCIHHFLTGNPPGLGQQSQCSLEASLTQLLDQDDNQVFDIYDVDLCILAFLEAPTCRKNGATWTCSGHHADDGYLTDVAPNLLSLTPCTPPASALGPDPCGAGLHCEPERNVCQRECGHIMSREIQGQLLDRHCTGAQKVCDIDRGRCVTVDVSETVCDVDLDCPAGAYCLLGRCAPTCYRAVDCPDPEWTCAADGRCRALPHAAADDGFAFVPENYAVRFTRNLLSLDAIQTSDAAPLAILDLITRREVLETPSVAFGYRLELSGLARLDAKCLVTEPPPDCILNPQDQMFARVASPFGTVAAVGAPSVRVELNDTVAEALPAGTYEVTLKAFFDNGGSDTLRVQYKRELPSGRYVGHTNVSLAGQQLNGNRPLLMEMQIHITDHDTPPDGWDQLLEQWGLDATKTIRDTTAGKVVHARLDGNSGLAFNHGSTQASAGNVIDFVGILTSDNTIRLVGLIEIPAGFCLDESGVPCTQDELLLDPGSSTDAQDVPLRVGNPFGRAIRRQINLVGPFDEITGTFSGLYREVISGLLPSDTDITLEGDFVLKQAIADDSPLGLAPPLLAGVDASEPLDYPDHDALVAHVEADIAEWCAPRGATEDAQRDAAIASALSAFATRAPSTPTWRRPSAFRPRPPTTPWVRRRSSPTCCSSRRPSRTPWRPWETRASRKRR